MKRFLKTINGKVSLIFVCMILLSIISVSISSSYARRNYRIRMLENEQRNLELSVETMNTSLKLFEEMLMYMPYGNEGLKLLEQIENNAVIDVVSRWQGIAKVNTQFRSMTSVFSYVENVFVYYPNQELFINSKVNENMTAVVLGDIQNNQEKNSQSWKLTHLSSGWYMYKIFYLRKAYVGAWISCDELLRGFNMNRKEMLMMDNQGQVLNDSGTQEALDKEMIFSQMNSEDRSFAISYLRDVPVYLINQIDDTYLNYSGEVFLKNGYFVMILGLNILTLLIIMGGILFWVHKPIKYLLSGIERIREGDIQYRIEGKTGMSLEFIEICNRFNDMLEQLNKIKIQTYEQEIERGKTKLRYLGQQIRSHFILNALNTVYNYSKRDAEATRKIIRLLSAYYRYVVNVDSDYVPLAEELRHIENYLAFQKIRYEDMLEYEIVCASELSVVPIPPFLMESFVGNSLKYGADGGDKIFISINIEQTGDFDLKIRISDHGFGFPEEVLGAVRCFKENGSIEEMPGVGLRNSIERLRLIYKDKANMEIYNDHGAVTEITIHLQKHVSENKAV